jgi:hypothetical protein
MCFSCVPLKEEANEAISAMTGALALLVKMNGDRAWTSQESSLKEVAWTWTRKVGSLSLRWSGWVGAVYQSAPYPPSLFYLSAPLCIT